MTKRPCLGLPGKECGRLTEHPSSRCPEHRRAKDRDKLADKRRRRPRIASEDLRRARVVAAHRATVGDWCPGWGRDPHPNNDLTADHPVAVAAGGAEGQALDVLCRSCNGAKGAR
jgi:5-methylcytosine-specific restriction protein A